MMHLNGMQNSYSWLVSFLIIVPLFGLLAVASIYIGLLVIVFVAMGLVLLGAPYTLIVAVHSFRNRKDTQGSIEEIAATFRRFPQQATFIINVILILNIAVFAFGTLALEFDSIMIISGVIAAVGGLLSIVFNAPVIFGETIPQTERAVVHSRMGKWRLILASRIISWVVWIGYSVVAVIAMLSFFGSFSY